MGLSQSDELRSQSKSTEAGLTTSETRHGRSQWCNGRRTDGTVRCTTGMLAHGRITDRHVPESLDVLYP